MISIQHIYSAAVIILHWAVCNFDHRGFCESKIINRLKSLTTSYS